MEELIKIVFENERIRIETIKSFGLKSGDGFWYDQDEEEIAAVTKGRAVLGFADGKTLEIKAGEARLLKRHEKHRVEYTSGDCEWYCVFIKRGDL